MQYTEILSAVKIEKFHQKIFDIFNIVAQIIDRRYTISVLDQNKENRYTPAHPSLTI